MELGFTIKDIKDGLAKSHFTAEEIFKKYSDKIKEEDKKFNAYLSTFNFQLSTLKLRLLGFPAQSKMQFFWKDMFLRQVQKF